ncbi:outer membrane protein [Roseibium aggregatum]|uniref:Porin family protein n=1 Tax=Roseibium aggregatum TaxID=187304 RepID=A0A939EID9_9HYPH|nr:outer membrane beta-barrel protein [Roseibium aggregatum]MBN9672833.1 porin family protein [Roseibium aggregatum]
MRIWLTFFAFFSGTLFPALAADLGEPALEPIEELRLTRQDWTGFSGVLFVGGGIVNGNDTVGWNTTLKSTVGGISLGYDQQIGKFVVGAHAEGLASNFEERTYTHNVRQRAERLGALTARLGYDAGRFMPYVSAGIGTGKYTLQQIQREVVDLLAEDRYLAPAPSRIVTDTNTLYGWVAGGGLEGRITDHVFVRADYKHFHLYDKQYQFDDGQPFFAGASADIIDLGIGYRF